MSRPAADYWRLLNSVEDYLRYGERVPRDDPESVELAEEAHQRRAHARAEQADGRTAAGGVEEARERGHRDRGDDAAGDGLAARVVQREVDDPDWDASDDELAVRRRRLAMLEERVRSCTRCPLHEGRMNAVPGQGVLDPQVMVVGEGPGAEEDRRGLPFVGRAGQYLDKWLEAIGLDRATNVYIGNVVKCRPPGNRDPRPHESESCLPYLREQIELIRPRVILTVGRVASGVLIGTSAGITRLRGRTYYYEGAPLIPTFHPSAVLRNQDLRRPVWDDLKRLRALVDSLGEGDLPAGEGASGAPDGSGSGSRA
ncbi:MAG: uracil-DNA glycosylase [Spirochaetota bacterium]